MLDRVAAFPVPVIAALNGHALGGGAEVAIAADIRIAADDVKIGFNQVDARPSCRPGAAPSGWPQAIGRGPAMLAIATGELYDAPGRAQLGLLDIVVPRADVRRRVARAGRAGWPRRRRARPGRSSPSSRRRLRRTHHDLEADGR